MSQDCRLCLIFLFKTGGFSSGPVWRGRVCTGDNRPSAEEIMAKAEQIRMSVASTQISAPQKINTSVTVSIGVSYHASWKPGLLETAIEEADRALYRAKQNGRNKTILFTD